MIVVRPIDRILATVFVSLIVVGCQVSQPTLSPTATSSPSSISQTQQSSAIASPTPNTAPPPTAPTTVVPAVFPTAIATPTEPSVPSEGLPAPTVTTEAATPVGLTATAASQATTIIPTPPPRDLFDLQRRLRPASAPSAAPTPAKSPDFGVGAEQTFWVANQLTKTYFEMKARIAAKTDHAYWYLEDGATVQVADVQSAATFFETQTYPIEHRLFGSELSPGIDSDVHITVLIGHVPGVGGYFSTADEYPRVVNPYSNEREMIYINVDSVVPGSAGFNGTVAHEFQHMIQFNVHRNQDSWVNEGAAELAAQAVTGATSGSVRSFEQRPDTQLNGWASNPFDAVPHYGAAYLFMRYVEEHYGGYSAIGKVIAEPGRSVAAFAEFFQSLRPPTSFEQVFSDWVAANELDDPSLDSGRYGYKSLALHPQLRPGPTVGQTIRGQAAQFGATYYRISATSAATLTFSGATTVETIGAQPHGARYEWWSNHGDSIDTRLTRSIDLRSVKSASLHFWIWYDIEDGYDYGYVEASADGGKTWIALAAQDTTTANPNGQSYGDAFTGTSGGKTPVWVAETVDLSPYAGREVRIRFEYVTDDSYNADGFALDGIEIPEIGWHDTVDSDAGWVPEGFTRIDNRQTESYLVEVLDPLASPVARRLTVDATGRSTVALTASRPIVLAVAGLAPHTTHQANFELSLVAS